MYSISQTGFRMNNTSFLVDLDLPLTIPKAQCSCVFYFTLVSAIAATVALMSKYHYRQYLYILAHNNNFAIECLSLVIYVDCKTNQFGTFFEERSF